MSDNYITAALAAGAVIITGAISSLVTLIISRRPTQTTADAALEAAEAAAQLSVNDGFAKLSATLLKRMDDLEIQNSAQDAQLRMVLQHLESLEAILRDQGIPIPPRIWELSPATAGRKPQ